MSFLDLLKHRRSIRQYKEEAVSKEALEAIVEAGLLSPSGRNIRPWELIVVQKKETLEKMSECRVGSAKMLAGASVLPLLRSPICLCLFLIHSLCCFFLQNALQRTVPFLWAYIFTWIYITSTGTDSKM